MAGSNVKSLFDNWQALKASQADEAPSSGDSSHQTSSVKSSPHVSRAIEGDEAPSSGDSSRQTSSVKSSSTGKSSNIYLPAWDTRAVRGQTPEKAASAEAVPDTSQMNRVADLEPVKGPGAPGAAAPEVAPKTTCEADLPPADEASATIALLPATSALPCAPLAPVPEPDAELAEEAHPFDDSGASLALRPSAQPQPKAISIPYRDIFFGGPSQVQDNHYHACVLAADINQVDLVMHLSGVDAMLPGLRSG